MSSAAAPAVSPAPQVLSPMILSPTTPRIRRKPAPKFDYSVLYPDPDPNDPLAPLSVLRSRHPDSAATSVFPSANMFSPTIPPIPQHNFATLNASSSSFALTADEPQWRRYTVVTTRPTAKEPVQPFPVPAPRGRKLSSHNSSCSTDTEDTPPPGRGRADKRKRAKSIAVGSLTPRDTAPPPVPSKSNRRRPSAAPSSSSASSSSSSSAVPTPDHGPVPLPPSISRASSTQALADFRDYPLHLLHTLGRDSICLSEASGDMHEQQQQQPPQSQRPATIYAKPMKVLAVDMPAPHMTREASVPPLMVDSDNELTRGRSIKKKSSRLSLFPRIRSRNVTPQSVPVAAKSVSARSSLSEPSTSSSASASDHSSDSGYATAESAPTPPTSAELSPEAEAAVPVRRSRSFSRSLRRKVSSIFIEAPKASAQPPASEMPQPAPIARRRSRSFSKGGKTHRKPQSAGSMKPMISQPVTQPVSVPFTFGTSKQLDASALAELEALRADAMSIPTMWTQPMNRHTPARPLRSHLRSASDSTVFPAAQNVGSEAVPALTSPLPPTPPAKDVPTQAPVRRMHRKAVSSPPVQEVPAEKDLSSVYQPHAKSPPLPSRSSPAGAADRPPLPKLAPLVTPSTLKAPRTAGPGPITPSRSFPSTSIRRRTGSLSMACNRDAGCVSPISPTSPFKRVSRMTFGSPQKREFVGLPQTPKRPVGKREKSKHASEEKHEHEQEHEHEHGVGIAGDALPSPSQLAAASKMIVYRESGLPVAFGDLWYSRRTVVLFIRHFWCPSCQDYLTSVMRDVDHLALQESGIQLIVVGCGPVNMIKSYRHIFRLPYLVFVDPSPNRQLYSTLGMRTLRRSSGVKDRGEYVKHGAVGGFAMICKNALKTGMPIWAKGGDPSQLGGELVLGPGLTCTYVHRMQNARGHAPILDVLQAAGVDAARSSLARVRFPSRGSTDSGVSSSESDDDRHPTRPSMMKVSKSAPGLLDGAMLVPTISHRSVGWESNVSAESGVMVRVS